MSVLTTTFDHAQRRVSRDAISLPLLGAELNDGSQSDVVTLPLINTLALKPRQMDAAWFTSNAGDYAKFTIGGGYEVLTGAKWVEPVDYAGAGTYAMTSQASGEYIRTSTAPGLNRGMFLSLFTYAAGDVVTLAEFGWSNSSSPSAATADVGFRLYTDGTLDIFVGGEFRQRSKLGTAKLQNANLDLFILPCRKREILIFTNGGGAVLFTFDEIPETATAPVITPSATKFFVTSGGGGNLKCQFAPLKFPASGVSLSPVWRFGRPPETGRTLRNDWGNPVFSSITNASLYGETAYAGTTGVSLVELRNAANSAAFTPNDTDTDARIRLTLTGDGSYTPFLYGAMMEYPVESVLTDDSEEFDASDWVAGGDGASYTLDVPDDPFGARMSFQLLRVDDTGVLLNDVLPNAAQQSFRPVKFDIGGVTILDAMAMRPRYADALFGENQRISFECESMEARLDQHVFTARVPLDGFELCEPSSTCAVAYVLELCGIDPAKMVLSSLGYRIGEVPHEDLTAWNVAIEPGMSGRQAMEMLHQLASDCVYGMHPGVGGPEFWFLSPDDRAALGSVKTIYRGTETAIANGIAASEAGLHTYDGYYEELMPISANEVQATGVDPRSGRAIISFAVDADSQDAQLPPSLRPPNWVGGRLPVGYLSRQFTSQAATDRAVEALLPLATELATVCGWNARFQMYDAGGGVMLPVWRMDTVTLEGVGDRLVSALSCRFGKEIPTGRRGEGHTREASYTGGVILGRGGTTVQQIRAAGAVRESRRFVQQLRESPLAATGVIAVSQVS